MSHRNRIAILASVSLLTGIYACSGGSNDTAFSADTSSSSVSSPAARFPDIVLNGVTSGLHQPVQITHAGDDRLFVVERGGRIRIVKSTEVLIEPFLDISHLISAAEGEQGLLGIAFPRRYAESGRFYVNYTDLDGDTVVSRFTVSDDPDKVVTDSEEVLLTVEQPYVNHNGGQITFGPDGYLYIAMGDGGNSGDPEGHGQNRNTPLGAILRIDVEHDGSGYLIPEGNPFDDNPVWVYGLRNPWRISFDSGTGDLYIADVGQSLYEEVNVQPSGSEGGENYGWNVTEGEECYDTLSCDKSNKVLPVSGYDHQYGDCAVTGGYVYRGGRHPSMRGIYFYGDFCSGKIWGLRRGEQDWETMLLRDTDLKISTFGEGVNGDIYLADYGAGTLYRLDRAAP